MLVRRGRRFRGWVLVTLFFLTGCVSIRSPAEPSDAEQSSGVSDAPVVIAVIDTGVNPYFGLYSWDGVLPRVTATATLLSGAGNISERLEADATFWENAQRGELYHFLGTRVYAISFSSHAQYPTFDSSAHGAYVNFLAAREAPRAVIVSIQASPELCSPDGGCVWDSSVADAMEWAAAQPWIDIITSSLGSPGSLPSVFHAEDVARRWVMASEAAARSGKVVIHAAANDPNTPVQDRNAGPPWVIAVGGAQVENQGEQAESAKGVDVVANFSENVPSAVLDNTSRWQYGNSFAAPIVAGTLADAIRMVRDAQPHAGQMSDYRRALNASAVHFRAGDWQPLPPAREDPVRDLAGLSLPILTQAQMGWGYVNGSLAPEIARRVLEGDLDPPPEKDQAILVQAEYQRAREEYWANWPR